MIVKMYKDKMLEEDFIDIRYREMNQRIQKILEIADYKNPYIVAKSNNSEIRIEISDILYIETVDKKYFLYTKEQVYETNNSLSDLEKSFKEHGFIRINRSTIVNLYKIKEIKSDQYMKMTALLINGEKVTISRHYRKTFFGFNKQLFKNLKEGKGI